MAKDDDKGGLYLRGMPYAPDLARLMSHYPDLKRGDMVEYSELEKVIDTKHGSQRFLAVISSWRKRLRKEQSLPTRIISGVGVRFLLDNEESDVSKAKGAKSIKAVMGAYKDMRDVRVEQLSEIERADHDHCVKNFSKIAAVASETRKQFEISPTPLLPSPRLVKKA